MELRGAQIKTLDPFEDIEHDGRFILVRDEDFLIVGDFAEVTVVNKCTGPHLRNKGPLNIQ